MNYPIVATTSLIGLLVASCNTLSSGPDTARGSDERISNATISAITATFGTSGSLGIALPRLGGIHPGDVFISPRVNGSFVTFPIQNRICNLGEELGSGVSVESKFPGAKTVLNEVFNWNASASFDLRKIFGISINSKEPVYSVQVKLSDAAAYTVSTTIRTTMYPDQSGCAGRVASALKRGNRVVVVDVIYNAAPFVRTAKNLTASIELKKAISVFSAGSVGTSITDTKSFGDETGGTSVLLAASYRNINSVAEARRQ